MLLAISCLTVYSLILAKCIISSMNKAERKRKRPDLSPYRISKAGIIKLEFGKRFKVDIDSEFNH